MRGLPLHLVVFASFAFCVIIFEPIEIQTHSVPKNDCLNLSFLQDVYISNHLHFMS